MGDEGIYGCKDGRQTFLDTLRTCYMPKMHPVPLAMATATVVVAIQPHPWPKHPIQG